MIRTRRLTTLTVGILVALPAAASATVNCPSQPTLNAWAGSQKVLTMAPCTSSIGAPVVYSITSAPAKGSAALPGADGTFTFTATRDPGGNDPIGPDSVTFRAVDSDPTPALAVVPISIGPAPVVNTTFKAKDLAPDTALDDGRPTFDVFYRTPVTATSTLTDPTPGTPLAAFDVRFRSGLGVARQAPTNAAGRVTTKFTPLVSDEYAFDAPALRGSLVEGYVLWVAPDWKLASTFPVQHRKFVISGRLLAKKSARTKGSYVRFQRKRGSKWVTVVSKVPVSASMTFTVKVSRAGYAGKRVRFRYVSKNVDYIGSSFAFTITAAKRRAHLAGRASTRFGAVGVRRATR